MNELTPLFGTSVNVSLLEKAGSFSSLRDFYKYCKKYYHVDMYYILNQIMIGFQFNGKLNGLKTHLQSHVSVVTNREKEIHLLTGTLSQWKAYCACVMAKNNTTVSEHECRFGKVIKDYLTTNYFEVFEEYEEVNYNGVIKLLPRRP